MIPPFQIDTIDDDAHEDYTMWKDVYVQLTCTQTAQVVDCWCCWVHQLPSSWLVELTFHSIIYFHNPPRVIILYFESCSSDYRGPTLSIYLVYLADCCPEGLYVTMNDPASRLFQYSRIHFIYLSLSIQETQRDALHRVTNMCNARSPNTIPL